MERRPSEANPRLNRFLQAAFEDRANRGDPTTPLAPSPKSSRFEHLGEIARDESSVLLRARDRDVDRDVALRVHVRAAGSVDAARRFLEDAQLAAQLQHPGILSVYGMGTLEDGRLFVALPVSDGPTLADVLASTNGSPAGRRRRVALVEQVAHALAYAHARGVAHGRLDASRVHLGEKGEVAVSGWDGAVRANGDPAPIAADVRALGELLAAALGKERDGELAELTASCAAVDGTRPRHAREVASRIAAYLAEEEASTLRAELDAARERARAAEARANARLERRRAELARRIRRRTLAVAAAVLLAVVLAAVGLLRHRSESRAESARADSEVAAALHEAERHEAAESWAEARAWAAKAMAIARAADRGTPSRASSTLARIESRAAIAADAAALRDRLEEIREETITRPAEECAAAYEEAFRKHRLPLADLAPAEATAAIRRRTIVTEIVRSLDLWAWFHPDPATGVRLLEIACAADPDPWRVSVRRSVIEGDDDKLSRAAALADFGALPRISIYILCDAYENRDLGRGAALMREAQRRAPDDPWIHGALCDALGALDLGRTVPFDCGPGRSGRVGRGPHLRERRRLAAAMVALSPEDPGWWTHLSVVLDRVSVPERRRAMELAPESALQLSNFAGGLIVAGRFEEALRYARRAVAVDPDLPIARGTLGLALQGTGDLDGAIRELREATQLDPDHWVPRANLGNNLWTRGDREEAAIVYRQARDRVPETLPARRHHMLGLALWAEGRLEDAAREFREARRLAADPDLACGSLGKLLLHLDRWEEAVPLLERALAQQLDPQELVRWRNLLAIAHRRTGRHEKTEALCRETLKLDPESALALHELGLALRSRGDLEGSIRTFRTMARAHPDRVCGHLHMAQGLCAAWRYEEAAASFRLALDCWPDREEIRDGPGSDIEHPLGLRASAESWLAFCLFRLGRHAETLAAADRVLAVLPRDGMARFLRGVALGSLGRPDEAIVALRAAAEIRPDVAAVHANIVRHCRESGRAEEAVAAARRALACDPYASVFRPPSSERIRPSPESEAKTMASRAELLQDLSWGLTELDRADEAATAKKQAVKLAEQAIEIGPGPGDWGAWSRIGTVLRFAGRFEAAVNAFRRVARIHPEARTYRWLANALRAAGKSGELTDVLRKLVELDPSPSHLNEIAWHLAACPEAEVRRPAEAVEYARRAIRAAPRNWGVWNTLGVALYRAGEHENAARALEESIRLRGEASAFDGLFLAMAHARLGHPEKARSWYARSVRWMETPAARTLIEENGDYRDELRRFRIEAEEVLGIEKQR